MVKVFEQHSFHLPVNEQDLSHKSIVNFAVGRG
jgi:hypothetical protein